MLAVDASVVVKTIVAEDGSAEVLGIVARSTNLIVPAHCFAEVGETLARKMRLGRASLDQVERVMPVLIETFAVVALDGLVIDAIRISPASGASVYDCLYVALPHAEQCPFVTADRRLVTRMKETPYAPLMRTLDSFNGSP